MKPHRLDVILCLLLIVVTFSVFFQVRNHNFLNYDDTSYVTENSHVQAGLTRKGIAWAFTTTHASNWHPLTWLSHMLDCMLFGLRPGMHHLSNLLFHIANIVLLFLILKRMTGALWRSVFVVAMFALHPLHVESVVWVAERKDLLCTLFWLLTMWAYIRYSERPRFITYSWILLFFILGLMSKPMIVTLPFVLLLMDYWPLKRLQVNRWNKEHSQKTQKMPVSRLIWEKIPLFILTAISSIMTLHAQSKGGSVASLDAITLKVRIINALVSYIGYIGKMAWPHRLAVFYPHKQVMPMWKPIGAGLLLVCISVLVIQARRKSPYLSVGWLWYLGTLVPVIGIVQVGAQSMADRYTYLPLIGLFIIIAWGINDLVPRWRYKTLLLALFISAMLLTSVIYTWLQIGYWQNSISLFKHTLDVTDRNFVAHYNLGKALEDDGRFEEALNHFSSALQIKPNYVEAQYNLGVIFGRMGDHHRELKAYMRAIQIKPDYAKAYANLGAVCAEMGLYSKAIWALKEALRLNPDDRVTQRNLTMVYEKIRK